VRARIGTCDLCTRFGLNTGCRGATLRNCMSSFAATRASCATRAALAFHVRGVCSRPTTCIVASRERRVDQRCRFSSPVFLCSAAGLPASSTRPWKSRGALEAWLVARERRGVTAPARRAAARPEVAAAAPEWLRTAARAIRRRRVAAPAPTPAAPAATPENQLAGAARMAGAGAKAAAGATAPRARVEPHLE
jgi:hypothetical protein